MEEAKLNCNIFLVSGVSLPFRVSSLYVLTQGHTQLQDQHVTVQTAPFL